MADEQEPKAKLASERIQLVAPVEFRSRIDEWRRRQKPIPNFSAAIRILAEQTLEREGF